MADIRIRNVTTEDAADIYEMNLALGYEYDLEKTRSNLAWLITQPLHTLLLAELGGQPVGYLHMIHYQCSYSDSMYDIMSLAVKQTCQRSGAGRALLTAAEDHAKKQGAAGIRLESGIARTGAHAFYLANGYTHVKDHKNFRKYFE